VISIESPQNENTRLRAKLAKLVDENKELAACAKILEQDNQDLKKENQKIRKRQYLSKKEQYLFEARLISEDVIKQHFVKMDTTAASIAAIPVERRELIGALNYLRQAGNCVCHEDNLSALRSGDKTQFTKEQVLVCFRVIHLELPEYTPSVRAHFWNH